MDDVSMSRTAEPHDRPMSTRQKLFAMGERLRPQWLKRHPISVPKEGFARAAVAIGILLMAGLIAFLIYQSFGNWVSGYADYLIKLAGG